MTLPATLNTVYPLPPGFPESVIPGNVGAGYKATWDAQTSMHNGLLSTPRTIAYFTPAYTPSFGSIEAATIPTSRGWVGDGINVDVPAVDGYKVQTRAYAIVDGVGASISLDDGGEHTIAIAGFSYGYSAWIDRGSSYSSRIRAWYGVSNVADRKFWAAAILARYMPV